MKRKTFIGVLCLWGLSWATSASDLAEKLKSRDHVLLMRHAYAPGFGDPAGYSLARCETQRVLNEDGKKQAQRNGQFFIDLVEAENSVGFHAPGEEMRILNQALDAIRKGQVAIRSRTSH